MLNQVSFFRRSLRRSDVFYSIVTFAVVLSIYPFLHKSLISVPDHEQKDEPHRLSIRQALAFNHLHNKEIKRGRMQKSFYEIGVELEVSKAAFHGYQCLYEDALAPYRNVKGIKILEIGLGCDIPAGPGISYKLWTTYFLDPDITFMEYTKPCGEKWLEQLSQNLTEGKADTSFYKLPKMFYGDMKNTVDLEQMAEEFGPWDVIIDDGFHEPSHQIPALKYLFNHVNPGGTYFVEDLYVWTWGNPDNRTILKVAELFTLQVAYNQGKFLKKNNLSLFDDMVSEWGTLETGGRVDRVTCCQAICGIRVARDK